MQRAKTHHADGVRAYSMVEVLVSVFVLAIMLISLYGGFTAGFAVVQVARENLRATQIMVQRIEAMRLFNWDQICNPKYLTPTFTESYDPSSGNGGTVFAGYISTNAPLIPGAAYTNNMRTITINVYWTNYHPGTTRKMVRHRQLQTRVARFGMQAYVYQ